MTDKPATTAGDELTGCADDQSALGRAVEAAIADDLDIPKFVRRILAPPPIKCLWPECSDHDRKMCRLDCDGEPFE